MAVIHQRKSKDRSSFINSRRVSVILFFSAFAMNIMIFIDAFAGWPGCVHDAKVFLQQSNHRRNAKVES